jgi:mono/diheme cytochrome c family protein
MNRIGQITRVGLWCAVALLSGCGPNPQAEFSWRAATDDLLPKGRDAVKAEVNSAFGTPHDLVAWERLPVEFGGIRGAVLAAPEGASLKPNVILVDAGGKIEAGTELTWLTGKTAAATANARQAVQAAKAATQDKETAKAAAKQLSEAQRALATAEKATVVKVSKVSEDGKEITLAHAVESAPGDTFVVAFGQQLQLGRLVYMKNCNHCHGVAGDGNGPTARYLNPRPRDYRLGLFKFTTTLSSERASREDLTRIVKYGIPGPYMPSFLLLDSQKNNHQDTAAVVEYIRWLAMRGEMEKRLGDELSTDYSLSGLIDESLKEKQAYDDAKAAKEKPEPYKTLTQLRNAADTELKTYLNDDFPQTVNDTADFIADGWKRGDDPASLIVPTVARVPDDAASRERGRLMYLSDKAKCYTCHGPKGRGNGAAAEDFWKNPTTNEPYEKRGLHDTWGNALSPRDLTRGQYRGGRRPIDVFCRVYAGIKGTPMPAFGGTVLKDSDIWDVVNYVMSLPYEDQRLPLPKPAEAPHMAATVSDSK